MSVQEFSAKPKAISFEEIVLNHIKDIHKLSQIEYRGGYVDKKIVGNLVEEVYVTDNRKRIIQAIEMLEMDLSPRFDPPTKKACDKIIKSIEENLKSYEKENSKMSSDVYVIKKLKLSLQLLRRLMVYLYKSGYLKRKVAGG